MTLPTSVLGAPARIDGYLPIEDYAAIGNLRTVALVGRDGAIDWWCPPHLDRPSVFGAALDAARGGRFAVTLPGAPMGEQTYVDETNVLETTFDSPEGRLVVTDFMPLAGNIAGKGGSTASPEIIRLLHAPGGEVTAEIEWSPRPDYARGVPSLDRADGGIAAVLGEHRVTLGGLGGLPAETLEVTSDVGGPVVRARVTVPPGGRVALVTRYGDASSAHLAVDEARAALEQTLETWRRWSRKEQSTDRDWAGEWAPLIRRSELALKLLTHCDTGAIAAAATTSLPETIGGVRNWDYRFCWIRDAAMTARAFLAMGHDEEMRDFVLWAERVSEAAAEHEHGLRIMYGLHGETELPLVELDHLEGYRGSRPVHTGNGAAVQRQPDIHGELLDAGYELVRNGYEIESDIRAFLPAVADRGARDWREPDHGLWEMPLEPKQYVYSKMMVWVALDRALRLASAGVIEGDTAAWATARDEIRAWVLREGYRDDLGMFVQHEGSSEPDASNLLLPVMGFLPFDDPRVRSTVDRTIADLTEDGLVYRYHVDDGLPGQEGPFVICTAWLIEVLALSGRLDEAGDLFDRLAARANHVGLLSEQIAATSGRFLGNFPQAFSHIGLINAAASIAYAQGRDVPVPVALANGGSNGGSNFRR